MLVKIFLNTFKKSCQDKLILDYGCGIGNTAGKVSKFNAKSITGIDISEVSISKAKAFVQEKINVQFKVDNCEESVLKMVPLTLFMAQAILHHLKIDKCLNEIHRILKKEGELVFIEPLGTNPLINIYRKLTPSSRSPDEHPLIKSDLNLYEKNMMTSELNIMVFLPLIFFLFINLLKNQNI